MRETRPIGEDDDDGEMEKGRRTSFVVASRTLRLMHLDGPKPVLFCSIHRSAS